MKKECIDLDMLISYFGNSLSENKRAEIIEHITKCPECLETFSSANHIMGNPELDKWEILSAKTARQIVKKMIPEPDKKPRKSFLEQISEWGAGLFSQQKFAAVRSEAVYEDDLCLIRKINILQTEIYLEESEADNATIKVKIIEDNKIAEDIILTLIEREEGKIFAQHLLSDSARFEAIPLGCYQLIIEQDGKEKEKIFFEINEQELYELKTEDKE